VVLKENFRGFYLWHATRGIEVPVPDAPLIAVMAKRPGDVLPLARALDAPRMHADGVFAPDYNILILSPDRLDDLGRTFTRQNQQIYQEGVKREELLIGKGPQLDTDGKDGKHPDDVARMQTLALVE